MPHHTLQLDAAALTHPGRVRSHNEDAFGYSVPAQCFVVCDGMGGTAGGALASRLAVETMLERLTAPATHAASPARRIEQAASAANRLIFTRARREPSLDGMGTTLACLLFSPGPRRPRAWVAHVGDSRVYRMRAGVLTRCTADHSLVEEQVRLGQLTLEEAAHSPLRHIITRALGVDSSVAVELQEIPVEAGDLFLLCSDGLTHELDEHRIAELAASYAGEAAGEEQAGETPCAGEAAGMAAAVGVPGAPGEAPARAPAADSTPTAVHAPAEDSTQAAAPAAPHGPERHAGAGSGPPSPPKKPASSMPALCNALVDDALQAGGTDNITCLAVHVA